MVVMVSLLGIALRLIGQCQYRKTGWVFVTCVPRKPNGDLELEVLSLLAARTILKQKYCPKLIFFQNDADNFYRRPFCIPAMHTMGLTHSILVTTIVVGKNML